MVVGQGRGHDAGIQQLYLFEALLDADACTQLYIAAMTPQLDLLEDLLLYLLGVVGKGTSASGLRVHLVLVAFVTKGMWASWAASSPYCAWLASLDVPGARSVVTIRHCAPTAGVRCWAHRRVRRNDTVRASCGLRVIAHQGDVYSAVRHRDSVWWAHYGLHCGPLAECKRGPAAE